MFTVREEQLRAFGAFRAAEFRCRLISHIRVQHPEAVEGVDPAEIASRVHSAIDRGSAYGLTQERSVALFVTLSFTIGPRFHEHPSAQRILLDSDIPPDLRMHFLIEDLAASEWADAGDLR